MTDLVLPTLEPLLCSLISVLTFIYLFFVILLFILYLFTILLFICIIVNRLYLFIIFDYTIFAAPLRL